MESHAALIFFNSFKSVVVLSLYSENAWQAAVLFGKPTVFLATALAVAGSTCGTFFNLMMGYYLSEKREKWFAFSDAFYQRVERYKNVLMFLLLCPFQSFPSVGVFWPVFVIIVGFFRPQLLKAFMLIVISRVLYYSYYLVMGV